MTINIASGSTQRGNVCGDLRGISPPSKDRSIHIISTSYNILGMVMISKFYTLITGEAAEVGVVPKKEAIGTRMEATGGQARNISTRSMD